MAVSTFDPNKYFVQLGGVTIAQFARGTFITIGYDADFWTDEVGANGDPVRILTADRRGYARFVLQSDSQSNDYLSGLASNDELMGNKALPLSCIDARGTSHASSAYAWVLKKPDQPFSSTEPTNREWTIRCAQLVTRVGGR